MNVPELKWVTSKMSDWLQKITEDLPDGQFGDIRKYTGRVAKLKTKINISRIF